MIVLALDIATRTGWAVGEPGRPPQCGTVELMRRGYDNGSIGCALIDWLADMVTVHAPGLIIYEAPLPRGQHAGIQAGRIALGLAMATEIVCHRREVRCREANVNTVRSKTVGRGNCSKPDVMAWCQAQGWTPDSLDASDACALWAYACQNLQHLRSAA